GFTPTDAYCLVRHLCRPRGPRDELREHTGGPAALSRACSAAGARRVRHAGVPVRHTPVGGGVADSLRAPRRYLPLLNLRAGASPPPRRRSVADSLARASRRAPSRMLRRVGPPHRTFEEFVRPEGGSEEALRASNARCIAGACRRASRVCLDPGAGLGRG